MADYPDFYKIGVSWTRRDWAAREAEIKDWAVSFIDPVPPGENRSSHIYEVPEGKRLYITESSIGGQFKGLYKTYSYPGPFFIFAALQAYNTLAMTYSTPFALDTGSKLAFSGRNDDTEEGKVYALFVGFETPASEPIKPKSDDPDELYKTGTFNWANVYIQQNGEKIIFFGKYKGRLVNCVRYKEIAKIKHQKISAFKCTRDEMIEIDQVVKNEPHKVNLAISKYEKKYKPKRWFRIR